MFRQSQTRIFQSMFWTSVSSSEAKQWSKIRYLGDFKPLFDYLRIHYSAPFVLQKFLFQKRIFVWCLALPFTSSFPYKFHCHHKKTLKIVQKRSKNLRTSENESKLLRKVVKILTKFECLYVKFMGQDAGSQRCSTAENFTQKGFTWLGQIKL